MTTSTINRTSFASTSAVSKYLREIGARDGAAAKQVAKCEIYPTIPASELRGMTIKDCDARIGYVASQPAASPVTVRTVSRTVSGGTSGDLSPAGKAVAAIIDLCESVDVHRAAIVPEIAQILDLARGILVPAPAPVAEVLAPAPVAEVLAPAPVAEVLAPVSGTDYATWKWQALTHEAASRGIDVRGLKRGEVQAALAQSDGTPQASDVAKTAPEPDDVPGFTPEQIAALKVALGL